MSLKKHLKHLKLVFKTFDNMNIHLVFHKSFLEYLFVHLLSQKMNVLNMIMMTDKLIIIINLKFSCTFVQLKKYLDLTEYLCQYIESYVTIFKPL